MNCLDNEPDCLSVEGRPPIMRHNTLCYYTVCLRTGQCEVYTPGWPAADQEY